jgi:hypothetical protein
MLILVRVVALIAAHGAALLPTTRTLLVHLVGSPGLSFAGNFGEHLVLYPVFDDQTRDRDDWGGRSPSCVELTSWVRTRISCSRCPPCRYREDLLKMRRYAFALGSTSRVHSCDVNGKNKGPGGPNI